MTDQHQKEQICCTEFNPLPWQDKLIEWHDKKFVKDHVCTFFFMPLNFGSVMKRLDKKVDSVGAVVEDWLCLSDHTTHWNMDLYLAVDKEVQGAENVSFSGKFFSKVYEGPFKDTGKWMKDFANNIKTKGYKTTKTYTWYTTCPKCAKKYGKNYVVVIAKIE